MTETCVQYAMAKQQKFRACYFFMYLLNSLIHGGLRTTSDLFIIGLAPMMNRLTRNGESIYNMLLDMVLHVCFSGKGGETLGPCFFNRWGMGAALVIKH